MGHGGHTSVSCDSCEKKLEDVECCCYCESYHDHFRARNLVMKLVFLMFIGLGLLYALDVEYPGGGSVVPTTLGISETRRVVLSNTWQSGASLGIVTYVDPVYDAQVPQMIQESEGNVHFVKLMKFSELPPLSMQEPLQLTANASIPPGGYTTWSRHFNRGSSLQMTWQLSQNVSVYAVKSTVGYKAFITERRVRWENPRPHLRKKIMASIHPPNVILSLSFTEDDMYYVIFSNFRNGNTSSGSFTANMSVSMYNVSDPIDYCMAPCSLSLSYGSSQALILQTPSAAFMKQGNISENLNFQLDIKNKKRGEITSVYFGVPMGVLGLISIFMIACDFCKMYACWCMWPTKEQVILLATLSINDDG